MINVKAECNKPLNGLSKNVLFGDVLLVHHQVSSLILYLII